MYVNLFILIGNNSDFYLVEDGKLVLSRWTLPPNGVINGVNMTVVVEMNYVVRRS